MSTITAIVHTKNSARTLDLCLKSLLWCDEIFVVDMESSDQTLAIAKKHKVTLFHEKSIKFADPVRNTYLKKVKTEWTLIVDSDEEVSPSLAKKLKELMLTVGTNGYKIPRANIIFGTWIRHTGFWPDYIIRLFRTGSCTYPPFVHGQPEIEGVTQSIESKPEFALIHHHYRSIEEYLLRLNVYTSLEIEKYTPEEREKRLRESGLIKSFFSEFHRRFFAQQGYLDGIHGLVISLLQAIYMMVVQMKLWEKEVLEGAKFAVPSMDSIESDIQESCHNTSYWVVNEKINSEKNVLKRVLLRFQRKIHS